MSKKGENIFKRKDGRWEARYIKERTLSGQIRYGFCYGKTYKEAKEKVQLQKNALLQGVPAATSADRTRVSYYCDLWLSAQQNRVKSSTYIKYRGMMEKHIKPQLGDCAASAMDTALIERFTGMLLNGGLSAKTVKDVLVILKSV